MAQSMDRANAQQPDKAKERDKSRKRNLLRLKKFVAHYCVHFNGAAAIRFAGYDTAWPSAYATELLTKPEVQDEIKKVRDDLGELHFDLANRATAQLTAMMQADRAGIFTPEGVVKDFDEWPEDCKLLLAGVEVKSCGRAPARIAGRSARCGRSNSKRRRASSTQSSKSPESLSSARRCSIATATRLIRARSPPLLR